MEWFGGLEKLKNNEKIEWNGMSKMCMPNKGLDFDFVILCGVGYTAFING